MRRLNGWLLAALMLLAACGNGGAVANHPVVKPSSPPRHVFLIVLENHSVSQVMRAPYIASLASKYGVAANYHAVAHPSVPNYLALTSGTTWDIQDDSYYVLPQRDLGTQLTSAGVSWKAYMEGMTAGCLDSPLPYDPGHNPFAYYGRHCPSNVVPMTQLETDLKSNTPRFTWISPDRCHDMHDCSVDVGDQWLQEEVPLILDSPAWKSDGVLFITWDEDDGSTDNSVLTLVITPHGKHLRSSRPYNHYSLLATIEDLLGVGRLGQAEQASPMTDLVPR